MCNLSIMGIELYEIFGFLGLNLIIAYFLMEGAERADVSRCTYRRSLLVSILATLSTGFLTYKGFYMVGYAGSWIGLVTSFIIAYFVIKVIYKTSIQKAFWVLLVYIGFFVLIFSILVFSYAGSAWMDFAAFFGAGILTVILVSLLYLLLMLCIIWVGSRIVLAGKSTFVVTFKIALLTSLITWMATGSFYYWIRTCGIWIGLVISLGINLLLIWSYSTSFIRAFLIWLFSIIPLMLFIFLFVYYDGIIP